MKQDIDGFLEDDLPQRPLLGETDERLAQSNNFMMALGGRL